MLGFRIYAPGVHFLVKSNVLALIQAWGLINQTNMVCIKLQKIITDSEQNVSVLYCFGSYRILVMGVVPSLMGNVCVYVCM